MLSKSSHHTEMYHPKDHHTNDLKLEYERTSTIFCEEMTTDGVSSPGNVSKRELQKQRTDRQTDICTHTSASPSAADKNVCSTPFTVLYVGMGGKWDIMGV